MSRWQWANIPLKTVMQYMKQNPRITGVTHVGTSAKIIKDYLKIVLDAVMDGQAVTLPSKFGTLYIQKKEQTKVFTKNIFTRKKGSKTTVEKMEMPIGSRFGYYYTFTLDGNKEMRERAMILRVDKTHYRKPLSDILENTNKDYRTNMLYD